MSKPAGAVVPAAQEQLAGLRAMFEKSKRQIADALPKHMTAERMIRVAMTAVQLSPLLMECSQLSIVASVVRASELGLELSGPLGQAYLVPFFNKRTGCHEAQLQIGYRGLLALAHRSGQVQSFNARVVHEKDHFQYAYGTNEHLTHIPAAGDRGKVTHVYALLRTTSGGTDFEVMSFDEVEAHRKRFSKARGGSPWDTDWDAMAMKTLIRRLAKRAPLSVQAVQAAVEDEYAEAGVLARQPDGTADVLLPGPEADQPPGPTRTQQVADQIGAPPEREPGAEG